MKKVKFINFIATLIFAVSTIWVIFSPIKVVVTQNGTDFAVSTTLVIFSPTSLDGNQKKFLVIFLIVVFLWLFSKIPLFVTGLFGIILAIILGVVSTKEALAPFADPIIFLFLGGFLLAQGMHQVGLDRRISLFILSRNFIKGSFNRMLFMVMCLVAVLSMWVSNTATVAMMLPIVQGVISDLKLTDKKITSLMLLAIAYSASVGGLGSPIGSPPNLIAIGLLKTNINYQITFLHWMLIGVPFVIVFLVILYFYIVYRMPKEIKRFNNSFILEEFKELPRISSQEILLMVVFFLTVFFWFSPGFIPLLFEASSPITNFFKTKLNPGVVAIFFSSLLFIFPIGSPKKILTADSIKSIDWGSLLLFGAGISLGSILFKLGLAEITGNFIIDLVSGNFLLFLGILVYFTIFFTGLVSNTAAANILIPIVLAASLQLGIPAFIPAVAVAICCSLAFMFPVGTPPNAIVYGSGLVEISLMMRVGFLLNILFGLIVIIVFYQIYLLW